MRLSFPNIKKETSVGERDLNYKIPSIHKNLLITPMALLRYVITLVRHISSIMLAHLRSRKTLKYRKYRRTNVCSAYILC